MTCASWAWVALVLTLAMIVSFLFWTMRAAAGGAPCPDREPLTLYCGSNTRLSPNYFAYPVDFSRTRAMSLVRRAPLDIICAWRGRVSAWQRRLDARTAQEGTCRSETVS